jgi:hypothetical protein
MERMRWVGALVGLLALPFGCDGAVSAIDGAAGSPASGASLGSGGGSDATGGAAGIPAGGAVELLDNPARDYPAVPPGSASFFWRGGLANWFVRTSTGISQDASATQVDAGAKEWLTTAEQGVTVDLWVQLNHPLGTPVDLSAYSGITFETELTGAPGPLLVALNANGDFAKVTSSASTQRFAATDDWQPEEMPFPQGADAIHIASIDFVVAEASAAFTLKIRNLALRCKASCP